MAFVDIEPGQGYVPPPSGPPEPWPHETRDLTNVEPYYEQDAFPFTAYLNQSAPEGGAPPEPYTEDWHLPPPVSTPWLLGIDEQGQVPDVVLADRALRRMQFNEARLAEAEGANVLAQDYNYQSLKPWDQRPWIKGAEYQDMVPTGESVLLPPDDVARLQQWRDIVFRIYGVNPDAARYLETAQLTASPQPRLDASLTNAFWPGRNQVQVNLRTPYNLMHEYVHAADPALSRPDPRGYNPNFQRALAVLERDQSEQARPYQQAVAAYPGDWQARPWEAYAELGVASGGRPQDMPSYLTPFYDYLFSGQPPTRYALPWALSDPNDEGEN